MFYAGFVSGVGVSALLVALGAVLCWFNYHPAVRGTADATGSVPFMKRKVEVRKPRVNDDRKAFQAEVTKAERR